MLLCLSAPLFAQVPSSEESIACALDEMRNRPESIEAVLDYNQRISKVFKHGDIIAKDSLHELILGTLDIAERLDCEIGIADANYSLGRFYISLGSEYHRAIPTLLTAYNQYEQLGDSIGMSKCYMQLGLIGYITQYFDDAVQSFEKSLRLYEYPVTYYLMAISYTELGDYGRARTLFKRAIRDFKANNDIKSIAEAYMYLGKLMVKTHELDSSFYYLKTSISLIQVLGSKKASVSRPYALLGEYFLTINQLDSAEKYALFSYLNHDTANDFASGTISAKVLSSIYEEKADYPKAHFYFKTYNRIKNSN